MNFYDWKKTRSYDAEITMVIGARGIGKTFGLRLEFIDAYLDKGYRFMEICRYKNEISKMTDGYFDKISKIEKYKDYVFKADSHHAYIANKVELKDGKKLKYNWEIIGYFASLSGSQQLKKQTFDNVRFMLFDECIIDKSDIFHHYLQNEFGTLANLVDTVSRERPGVDSVKPRIFLLANACDIANPYMAAFGVGTDLEFGYRWYYKKRFLLHYVKDDEYSKAKAEDTVAGHMYSIIGDNVAVNNIFDIGTDDFIEKKTPKSIFRFGVACNGKTFGIWADYNIGIYYINKQIPKNGNNTVFALTMKDNRINYIAAKRAGDVMKDFMELYYYGMLRYENHETKMQFEEVLTLLGIR